MYVLWKGEIIAPALCDIEERESQLSNSPQEWKVAESVKDV